MTVGKICQRELDLTEVEEPIVAAAQRMGARNVGTLVVVDANKAPIGILTDRDIAVRVVGSGREVSTTKVGDVMTRYPKTVAEHTPIETALGEMRSAGIRRLLVIGQGEQLIGIVSLDDIVRHLGKELEAVEELLEESSPRVMART